MFTGKSLVVVLGIVLASAAGAFAQEAAKAPAGKLRIGTYDTRAVALAYLRSEESLKQVSDRYEEYKKAKAAGDQKRMDELKPQGEHSQQLAHAQVFSNAPIDNILLKLKDGFPAAAKKANVSAIVPSADWTDPSIELVDVTELLAEQFKPTEQTRKMMTEIRKSKPLGIVEAVLLKD